MPFGRSRGRACVPAVDRSERDGDDLVPTVFLGSGHAPVQGTNRRLAINQLSESDQVHAQFSVPVSCEVVDLKGHDAVPAGPGERAVGLRAKEDRVGRQDVVDRHDERQRLMRDGDASDRLRP